MRPKIDWRGLAGAALVAASALVGIEAHAAYPDKPVTLVVPFPAGGFSDNVGRFVAKGLSERWGVPVIVDNRAGAGGTLGAAYASKQPADGYTLFLANTASNVISPLLNKVDFDPVKDLDPVALVVKTPNVVTVGNGVPASSVPELVKLAKSKPGVLNFGTPGNGTTGHFTGALFNKTANIQMQHVPYKGTPAVQTDIINGTVQVAFDNVTSWAPQVKAGRMKALAVTSTKRSPLLPDIPTLQELGYQGFESTTFAGIAAPRGTPRDIIAKLNKDINAVIESEDFKKRMNGGEVSALSADDFGAFISREQDKWGKVARDIGLKAD